MKIVDLAICTPVAHPGMTVLELFQACVEHGAPGLPYRNVEGIITGKASIRHVMKETCIPDFMIKHHHLLGDGIEHLLIPEIQTKALLAQKIDIFLFPDLPSVNPEAPLSKALAIMENHNTTYLFVMDHNSYFGLVTVMGIARHILTTGEEAL
jgi:hypothetical protein